MYIGYSLCGVRVISCRSWQTDMQPGWVSRSISYRMSVWPRKPWLLSIYGHVPGVIFSILFSLWVGHHKRGTQEQDTHSEQLKLRRFPLY
jgi:hypothetical protein